MTFITVAVNQKGDTKMMNVSVPSSSDEGIFATLTDDQWSFDVFIEPENHLAPDMNIYSFDEYENIQDRDGKSGILVINEKYLNSIFKKQNRIHPSEFLETQIIISDTDWWPEQSLNMYFSDLMEEAAWMVLGKAMKYAEEWTSSKWMDAACGEGEKKSE